MKRELRLLIFSLLATFCLAVGGKVAWTKYIAHKSKDPRYQITKIIQTGPEKEALRSGYLAELLHLSRDIPLSLYVLDCKRARELLLLSPLIREASVKKRFPNAIYIDYEVRKPVARLADYENLAIDKEGYLFPIAPFFSPKELPEIYLGLPPFGSPADLLGRAGGAWQKPLDNRFATLAAELLLFLEEASWKEGLRIKRIDLSNAFAPSLGQREIVLFTEEEFLLAQGRSALFPKLLRLSPKDYAKQLSSFFLLRRHMEADYRKQLVHLSDSTRFSPRIIDLRIPQLAFVENQ